MKKFNLLKAIRNDYSLFVSVVFMVITILFIILGIAISDVGVIIIFCLLEVVFVGLFFWRKTVIDDYFEKGIEVQGKITKIFFTKDRGRVAYTYSVEGKDYQKGLAIMKTKVTNHLNEGEEVLVLVKSTDVSKAIIKDLFI